MKRKAIMTLLLTTALLCGALIGCTSQTSGEPVSPQMPADGQLSPPGIGGTGDMGGPGGMGGPSGMGGPGGMGGPDGMGGPGNMGGLGGMGGFPGNSGNLSISDIDVTISELDVDDMFTKKDRTTDYEEADVIPIYLADNASACDYDGVTIANNTVTITDEGTYLISGSLTDGQLAVSVDATEDVRLILDGVSINSDSSAALYVKEADKVIVTLAPDSTNSLQNSGKFVTIDENDIDGAIFSKGDLTFNGSGHLTISSESGHGVVSKDDLVFIDGNYDITSTFTAISGKDSIRIADGTFIIQSGKDALHSEHDDTDKGFIYIEDGQFHITGKSDGLDASGTLQVNGGNISMNAGDDAFHSNGDLLINDGSVTISSSYEGLEGQTVTINGGTISLNSSDDGINAAGGNDQSGFLGGKEDIFASDANSFIAINGGEINIFAKGDGIDSNGAVIVTGGKTTISGPENSGNASLDYGTGAVITGGTFLAAGHGGMAVNFGTGSTQGAMLVSLSETLPAGASRGDSSQPDESTISIKDASGKELLSFTPQCSYNCVLISTPDIREGESYILTAGGQDYTVEMSSITYKK